MLTPWHRPWQVVRDYRHGALLAVCGHRTYRRAAICASVQRCIASITRARYDVDVRRNPRYRRDT
jgi:hypothetical protein